MAIHIFTRKVSHPNRRKNANTEFLGRHIIPLGIQVPLGFQQMTVNAHKNKPTRLAEVQNEYRLVFMSHQKLLETQRNQYFFNGDATNIE